jgi:hypothetical protein
MEQGRTIEFCAHPKPITTEEAEGTFVMRKAELKPPLNRYCHFPELCCYSLCGSHRAVVDQDSAFDVCEKCGLVLNENLAVHDLQASLLPPPPGVIIAIDAMMQKGAGIGGTLYSALKNFLPKAAGAIKYAGRKRHCQKHGSQLYNQRINTCHRQSRQRYCGGQL